jgi:hypothetical protein
MPGQHASLAQIETFSGLTYQISTVIGALEQREFTGRSL